MLWLSVGSRHQKRKQEGSEQADGPGSERDQRPSRPGSGEGNFTREDIVICTARPSHVTDTHTHTHSRSMTGVAEKSAVTPINAAVPLQYTVPLYDTMVDQRWLMNY